MIQRTFLVLATLFLATVAHAGQKFADISHDELKQAIASKSVVLLDVNGSKTYASGHIPGAIDFSAKSATIASVLPADKNTLIVAYCGNEKCGAYARAAQAAKDLGYTNVKHYSKGIAGWKAAGEPVGKSS